MWKIGRFKLSQVVKILLFFLNYSPAILAQGFISKTKGNQEGVSTKENQLEFVKSGEIWIVVNEISCWESNGGWEKEELCSNSTIVSGHRFKFLSRTGLTGIQLKCTRKFKKAERKSEKILQMKSKDEAGMNLPRGEWESWTKKSRSSFAVGFSFAPGEMNLRRSVKNFELIYHTKNPTEMAKQSALNSGRVVTKCPENHAICGVTAMTDKTGLGILTAIGLKCCFHCIPEEKLVNLHHFDNPRTLDEKVKVNTTVGLGRELQNSPSDLKSTLDSLGISVPDLQKIFALIGQSTSTGIEFDWIRTAPSMWTDEKTVSKMYSCGARRSCVFKQLVGQCGSVRVLVDKFCQGSVPIGNAIPESCIDPQPRSLKSCSDAMEILPSPRSPKQIIYPHGNATKVKVVCDFGPENDGGGWTVIQKRSSGPRNEFDRGWSEYARGFGSLSGNFWLGLKNIHTLTKNGDQELRIELEDFEGNKAYAKYSRFSISDASDFYRLTISGFSRDSTAGDSMTDDESLDEDLLDGMRFSTKDKDNDNDSNCADLYEGGWWYNSCSWSQLNGLYYEQGETVKYFDGVHWESWKGQNYSLAKTEMKIRTRKSDAEFQLE